MTAPHNNPSADPLQPCTDVEPYPDEGVVSAEYAFATLAAVAFAGALLWASQNTTVRNALLDVITRALGTQ